MSDRSSLPSRKKLEKEIADYLSEKYGEKVNILTSEGIPDPDRINENEKFPVRDFGEKIFNFRIKPEELIAYLDEYVIRQDKAKAVLATKICTHFNRIRHAVEDGGLLRRSIGQVKSNVLLIGTTGVGKTFLIKLIASKLGVPFVKGDATKFSETGYVGGDVEDLVRDLVREADGDIEKAQFGIIYVDEIDKIASSQDHITRDVSRTGVQRALLKPMEETEVELKVAHDPISQLEAIEYYRIHGKRERQTVNTKNILFIMSGAFTGLEEIVKKRAGRQSMGFESTVASRTDDILFLSQAKAEDLIRFGFESEFVGRLPVVTVLDELSEKDLYEILKNPNNSVVIGKKQDFRSYGIKLIFEDDALQEIASLAVKEKTGARGLLSVMEKVMLPYEKKLPSMAANYLVVSRDMVLGPEEGLDALLSDTARMEDQRGKYEALAAEELENIASFLRKSRAECFLRDEIVGSAERLRVIARMCQTENLDSNDACELFVDLIGYIMECEVKMSSSEVLVSYSEDAINRILEHLPKTKTEVWEICERIYKICEPAFRLLSEKKDVHEVVITADAIDDPEKFINELVEKKFMV